LHLSYIHFILFTYIYKYYVYHMCIYIDKLCLHITTDTFIVDTFYINKLHMMFCIISIEKGLLGRREPPQKGTTIGGTVRARPTVGGWQSGVSSRRRISVLLMRGCVCAKFLPRRGRRGRCSPPSVSCRGV
jgi:hypothetical protein